MRKVLITAAVLAASCSGQGEVITPSPAPETSLPHNPASAPFAAQESIVSPAQGIVEEAVEDVTTTMPATTVYVAPVTTRKTTTTVEYTTPTRSSTLASIRACESGSDYSTDTGNGYYGAYQFSRGTWASVGGSGNPALASPAEQDMRAQMMIDSGRRGEWPNC